PRIAVAAATATSPPWKIASLAMAIVRRSPDGSSARRTAMRVSRSLVEAYAFRSASTARGPMTASRAIAASRRTSSDPPRASTSSRTSADDEDLMGTEQETREKGKGTREKVRQKGPKGQRKRDKAENLVPFPL